MGRHAVIVGDTLDILHDALDEIGIVDVSLEILLAVNAEIERHLGILGLDVQLAFSMEYIVNRNLEIVIARRGRRCGIVVVIATSGQRYNRKQRHE